jgi:uncharacterized protein YndB with AHSA1/START domain
MPPNLHASAETKVVIDRAANAIVMTRTFSAPREDIFAAWTRPAQVACWWDASGAPLAACEIDLRPGGAFRFATQGRPEIPPFSGVYREISPPEKIVFDAMGAVGTVLLREVGGTTLMTVSIACPSAQHLDQFLQMGVDVGTARTLDNLVAYIAAKRG